jgi:hypothetical protein
MKPNGVGLAVIGGALAVALGGGCSSHKTAAPRVLSSRDFVADPGTMPTDASSRTHESAASPSPAGATKTITGAEASEGIVDVVAVASKPTLDTSATPSGDAVLIDQKVGEINGRPVRVKDIFDDVGQRLETTARTKKLSAREWQFITGTTDPMAEMRTLTRDQWLAFARLLCMARINLLLEDELLEAEARASLKPEQKQGLAWLVQEASENLRRENEGSRAAAEKHLEETSGKTEQQWMRENESRLLIMYQLDERIRKRVRVSWKDVQLYYERNSDQFNPPPMARFRLIRVPASDAAGLETVQKALDGGEPFAKVAAAAPNTYKVEDGGLLGDRPFSGDYVTANFGLPATLQDAAHGLKPGEYTKAPVGLGKDKVWVLLESVSQKSRPLSDQDVQLEIARKLTSDAESTERENYVNRLKERASFTDLDAMVNTLVEAAAERYWPKG